MCLRVGKAIAEAERNYGKSDPEVDAIAKQFADAMARRDFMPNSPTLMNAGKNNLGLSACYVVPVEDSMEGIFDAIKQSALIHQSGGGTGFSYNRLRPSGSLVKTTGGIASGPVSFMKVFDAATGAVSQAGVRRGACIGVLQVNHPDILEFIQCKLDGGITNFNISVAITDEFIRCVDEDAEIALVHGGKEYGRVNARKLWDEIVDSAWKSGDPGLIFIDTVNNSPSNPTPQLQKIEATNPCGELALFPHEACTLASINLGNFVKEIIDMTESTIYEVDWKRLREIVRLVVRFLDNLIDVNPYPLPQIEETAKKYRRIGLGVMGWADMLIKMEVPMTAKRHCCLQGSNGFH